MQLSGSLRPVKLFLNGQDRTDEKKEGKCSPGVFVNNVKVQTQGTPGIFFWEGAQETHFNVSIGTQKKCWIWQFKIPSAFFERQYQEMYYLDEGNIPLTKKIALTGDVIEGTTIELDQGEIIRKGNVLTSNHELKPGENIITGIIKDERGKETPLSFNIKMDIQRAQESEPALALKIHERELFEDEVKFSGRTFPSHRLWVNETEIEIDDEGKFSEVVELKEGKQTLEFKVQTKDKELVHKVDVEYKKEEIRRLSLPESSYIGVVPLHLYAHESDLGHFRVNENLMAKIVYGQRIGEKSFEFVFRMQDEDDVYGSQNQPPNILKNLYVIGALRLQTLKRGFHYGYGTSFGTIQRRIKSSSKLTTSYDLNLIGRIGWMWSASEHWHLMATFSPFIAFPQDWEKYGFDLSPLIVTYSF